MKAFHGSLDAAKALHEALLPGCGWMMGDLGSVTIIPRNATGPTCRVDNNPARAWLLAILRALEAEGRT